MHPKVAAATAQHINTSITWTIAQIVVTRCVKHTWAWLVWTTCVYVIVQHSTIMEAYAVKFLILIQINRNKYLNFFLFKIVNQLTYNEPCNTSVSVKMCNYVTNGLACSNSSSTCQCSKTATFWSQNKNACGKL